MSAIVNGAGMAKPLGTKDSSGTVLPVTPEQIPQHLPKIFIFAEQGSGEPRLLTGSEREKVYGQRTFDVRSPYFNHQTLFANEMNGQGNAIMYQRMIPTDAGPMSNAILWLDILETTVDQYQRNPDGSIALNEVGEPTITGTTPGLKAKWVKTHRTTLVEQETFGDKTQAAGDQVDNTTMPATVSVRYPIFEIQNGWQGKAGNNTCFCLDAPTASGGNSLPVALMNQEKIYPYSFRLLSRVTENDSAKPIASIQGEQNLMFSFKKDIVDPTTRQALSWDQRLPTAYHQVDNPPYPDIPGRISKFYAYEANIEAVLDLMYEYEKDHINAHSDIDEEPTSKHLLNFVTGVSSKNVPYQSFIFVDSPSSVRMSASSEIYLSGGSDGTMSNAMFETLVSEQMDRYLDPEDEIHDIAKNVESVVYDSGFGIDTKFKLAQFIAIRKDTVSVVGTHTVGQPALTAAEEHSVAISLRTRFQMYPESTYFGTPVCRAIIMGRSGKVRNSEYTERVPATFELAYKFSRYMGAGDGKWKNGRSPSGAPGSIVTRLKSINITWSSDLARNRDWDVGLNWILRYNTNQYFIPHYKTVYDDDTSVLNSILVAFAIAELNKVGVACWREFSGTDNLSGQQLIDACNQFVRDRTEGRFDNRYLIEPRATITDLDALRGFSWTLPIDLGADPTRTVMTTYVEAKRKETLAAELGA